MKKASRSVLALLLCLLCLFNFVSPAVMAADIIDKDDIAEYEARLEEIKKAQAELQKSLSELEINENYASSAITYCKSLIDGYIEYSDLLAEVIAQYDKLVEETDAEIAQIQKEYDNIYDTYMTKLRAVREEGNYSVIELVMTSKSIGELFVSLERITDALSFDEKIMEELAEKKNELRLKLTAYERYRAKKQEQATGYEKLKEDIDKRIADLNSELDKIGTDKSGLLDLVDDFTKKEQEAGKELDDLLDAYNKQQNSSAEYAKGEKMIWPLDKEWNYISSYFDYRNHPVYGYYHKHRGVDIPASKGENIYAALSGKVVTAAYNSSYGNYVIIDHGIFGNTGKRMQTVYAHSSKLLVKKGDFVDQGDVIALVGTTGSSTGNHLHFEIRLGSGLVDPLEYAPRPK